MHLIRLELYGFKSFSNKTEFSFSPGITALVGPNGCGKSNVVDAIRWVLGEQNPRTLRANKMTDLVYAGTENSEHKNFAEVTVVLDNCDNEIPLDFREVTVTRRYYRSGESEYFLNRVPCRLKDISEVMASTSLGRGTYAIIGQGEVAEVINSRPEDRRLMFEEAAGISLYKMRKSEALKKLGDTQSHLTRIDDIIHELQGQEEDIRESAAKAKVFLELKGQADKLELSLWAARYFDLQKRLDELEERRQSLAAARQQYSARSKEMENQLAETAAAMQECAQVIAALENNRTQLVSDKTQHDYQLQLSQQRHEDFTNLVFSARQRLTGLKAQLEEFQSGDAKIKQALQETHKTLGHYTLAHKRRSAAAALVRRLLAAAENYRGRADDWILQAAMASTEFAASRDKAQKAEAELAGQIDSVRGELVGWQDDRRQVQKEIDEFTAVQASIQEKNADFIQQETKLRQEHKSVNDFLKAESSKQNEAENAILALEQKIKMLKAMDEEFQGYAPGVRAVLKAGKEGRLAGVYGAVGELIQVIDPRHSLAIETALGGALQYVVCDIDSTCRQAIELLKENKAGRATFIPVTAARTQIGASRKHNFSVPVLGWADALIRCSSQAEPAVRMLLENVLVAENLAHASELAVATNYRHKIVTLEGEVISRGLYTGGSGGRQGQGVLQRKAGAEKMREQLAALRTEFARCKEKILLAQEKKNLLQAKLDIVGRDREQLERELIRLSAQVEQAQLRETQIAERESARNERLTQLETRLAQVRLQLAGISSLLDQDKAGLERTQSCKEKLQSYEFDFKEMVALWSSRQNSLQLTVYSLQNHRENLERQLKSLDTQVSAAKQGISQLAAEIAGREEQQSEMETIIQNTRQALAEIAAGLETVSASLDGQVLVQGQLQANIKQTNQSLAALREELEQIQASLHDIDLKKARWQVEAEGMASQLQAQYGLDPQKGLGNLDNRYTIAQLTAKVKSMQVRLEELGEVNLASIQQHNKLAERLGFLSEQRSDLARAAQDIIGLVTELDEKIRNLFMETFEQVQAHFSRIFRILFAGGSAYLALSDDQDPLETGIEIFARPSGKRTQSLTLLSGGEKALTAIALLFALQSVRPSPFCILDEIEAALDDVNILRFTEYLRQLAQDMQFILITHRRETMEHSDSLYGITLNQEGASQPISVVLNDDRQRMNDL